MAAVIALSGCGATKSGQAKSTPRPSPTATSGSPLGTPGADSASSTGESGGTQRSTPTASPSVTARPLKAGTALLTHCANEDDPYVTVEVRNPNSREGLFAVKVHYKNADGFTMSESYNQVSVSAKGKTRLRVAVASMGPLDEIARCEVVPRASVVR
ncbi:hypothetical protein [Streptomyces sp. NPDC004579]|uniref:hypothetical protein n=1 Tax=Streptomyces sp. NPDC004579 TaxID=3154667 RepID=UPI0033AA1FB2